MSVAHFFRRSEEVEQDTHDIVQLLRLCVGRFDFEDDELMSLNLVFEALVCVWVEVEPDAVRPGDHQAERHQMPLH